MKRIASCTVEPTVAAHGTRAVAARATLAALGAIGLTLTACGGNSDASSGADLLPAPSAALVGTAYLKTSNTVHYRGKDRGFAREAFQAQVDQCNGMRSLYYGLQAVSPPEATLASLDVLVHEKFFDTDKALTLITGTGLTLPDVQRWLRDADASAATGTYPALPMDCAQVERKEIKNGTLWRDGIKYELRYATLTATGTRVDTSPTVFKSAAEFAALPAGIFLGQACRQVTAPATALLAAGSTACIWDAFPYVGFLNLPFALSGELAFGTGTALVETIEPLAVERGKAIAASTFTIPAGFTITALDAGAP
jgi:hypothetical protein